jgi:SAM-dependent methyltransferase
MNYPQTLLLYVMFLAAAASLYIVLTAEVDPKPLSEIIEGFSSKLLSDDREDKNKLRVYPDHNDKVYARLFELVTNEPALYRHDIIKIKDITKLDDKSRVLEAGCGLGRHMAILREIIPNISIEGVDRSKSMINRSMIRNPGAELLCTSLTIPEIYKPETLTHVLCLHETLNHNTPKEVSNILNNFHKWLVPDGYLVVHILDPNKLDPGPRAFSQYFKAKDDTRHSLTYFESFTHEAWWEKEDDRQYWYRYCEKYIFPRERVKVHTTPLWIPPVNRMITYITRHNFKLKEVIELNDIDVTDFNLYVFKKS